MKSTLTLSAFALLMATSAQAAPSITPQEEVETLHLAGFFERDLSDGIWATISASFEDDEDDRYEDEDDRYDDDDEDDDDDHDDRDDDGDDDD